MKVNCWEFRKCGRQPGGTKVEEFGVCPAAISKEHNGKNGGQTGGRYCWKAKGTLSDIHTKNNKTEKILKCIACEFYKLVQDEQGSCIEM
ncbi:MAG: hypothetical protein CVV39_06565 [Planctomycetes bacterium HGW-Planctomycetes-1]|nr:MAG: hypothetical protein CVV39_06565 [Planctomycetes bacterium HGW-Planctomycetes-1]